MSRLNGQSEHLGIWQFIAILKLLYIVLDANLQGSAMRNMDGISTTASEAMRTQRIDVIRDIMSREEEGTLRMSVLQQMLEQSLQPLANASTNSSGSQQWWA
jgi:hypothetical protein